MSAGESRVCGITGQYGNGCSEEGKAAGRHIIRFNRAVSEPADRWGERLDGEKGKASGQEVRSVKKQEKNGERFDRRFPKQ